MALVSQVFSVTDHEIMSKKKGLSLDEKRQRMLDFFYEKKDFFQLKELERLCQKEKGINSMSVKDVLMSLVHDGLVDTDKIGTSVYFWAFPSKAAQKLRNNIEKVMEDIQNTRNQISKTTKALDEALMKRKDTEERNRVINKLTEQKLLLESLSAALQNLKKYDPDRLLELKQQELVAIDSVNRWTDNIFIIKSWLNNKFSLDEATFCRQFEIPENFDYIS